MKYQTITFLAFIYLAPPTFAATLHVQMWGEAMPCGSKSVPCASITDAVLGASPGDKILVGPGSYTENVVIDKERIRLQSTAGARSTIIRADDPDFAAISVSARKVQVGKRYKGFSVTGSTEPTEGGIHITSSTYDLVKIEGNIAYGNATGFNLSGDKLYARFNTARDNTGEGIFYSLGNKARILDNRSNNNNLNGFRFTAVDNSTFQRNLARSNNQSGMRFFSNCQNNKLKDNVVDQNNNIGIRIDDFDGTTLDGNIAAQHDSYGVYAETQGSPAKSSVFQNNLVTNSGNVGFNTNGENEIVLRRNTFVFNENGIRANSNVEFLSVGRNNFFAHEFCGYENYGGHPLVFNNDFFGSPAGFPGPDTNGGPDNHDENCGPDLPTGKAAGKMNPIRAKAARRI